MEIRREAVLSVLDRCQVLPEATPRNFLVARAGGSNSSVPSDGVVGAGESCDGLEKLRFPMENCDFLQNAINP